MQDKALLFKLAIGILSLIGYVVLVTRATFRLTDSRFRLLMTLIWFLTRVGLYCVVFLVFRQQVTSDVSGFYYPEGQHAKVGEVVFRDFSTSYAPVFPYLIAVVLSIWDSAKAIVLATIVIDGVALIIWLRAARGMWSETEYRTLAIFYVLSSFAILNVAIAGQNQVWVSLLLGVAVLLYQQGRPVLSAVVAGLPVVLIKLLPIVYIAAFVRWRSKPIQTALTALLLPVLIYGFLFANRIDILQPVRMQGSLITSGTIPYLLTIAVSLLSSPAQFVSRLFAVLAFGFISLYLLTRPSRLSGRQVIFAIVILAIAFPFVSQKFFSTYLMMAYAPICAVAAVGASPLGTLRFGIFNLVAGIEPSLWFRLLHGEEHNSQLWQVIPRLREAGELWKISVFLGVELLLLSLYAYYFLKAWRLFRESSCHAHSPLVSIDEPVSHSF